MRDYLEPHLPWLEKAVGCKYSETVTFGTDLPIILGRWSPSSLTTKARCRSLNTSSDGADRAASSKKPERNSLFMQLEGSTRSHLPGHFRIAASSIEGSFARGDHYQAVLGANTIEAI